MRRATQEPRHACTLVTSHGQHCHNTSRRHVQGRSYVHQASCEWQAESLLGNRMPQRRQAGRDWR